MQVKCRVEALLNSIFVPLTWSKVHLNYAQSNRPEWESRGQQVVEEMMVKIRLRQSRSAGLIL